MIRFRDKIFPEYFIDPETAIITNSKGEIQKIIVHKDGRPYFKGHSIHKIQVHTHIGYKKGLVIHHIDENKMNNSLSNLVYLTISEHMKIHSKGNTYTLGKKLSDEHKRRISEAMKGRTYSEKTKNKISETLKGRTYSNERKRKMSEAHKGRAPGNKGKKFKWINNGVENIYIPLDAEILTGYVRGRLKK